MRGMELLALCIEMDQERLSRLEEERKVHWERRWNSRTGCLKGKREPEAAGGKSPERKRTGGADPGRGGKTAEKRTGRTGGFHLQRTGGADPRRTGKPGTAEEDEAGKRGTSGTAKGTADGSGRKRRAANGAGTGKSADYRTKEQEEALSGTETLLARAEQKETQVRNGLKR